MGEAKRRQKLASNLGKEKEIIVNVSDDIYNYQGKNPDLIKIWETKDQDSNSVDNLFSVSIEIKDLTYEGLYGLEIKPKAKTIEILHTIYMASSKKALGDIPSNQIKTAIEIKRKVIKAFQKTQLGMKLFEGKENLDSVNVPEILVTPDFIVF